MGFILGFVIGLVVGWFLLPKPAWAQNLWNKAKGEATAAIIKAETPAPVANTPVANT
jgi:hypothetical protein